MYYVIQLVSSFPEKYKGGPDNEQVPTNEPRQIRTTDVYTMKQRRYDLTKNSAFFNVQSRIFGIK